MKYLIDCVDSQEFMNVFDEKPGATIIEIGCHDESAELAVFLQEQGYEVLGFDLREPDKWGSKLHGYHQVDWCDLPPQVVAPLVGKVDAIYSISAIEHFGLSTYGEVACFYYDILASRQAWQLLKPGGTFYITVPYGAKYKEVTPHYRVYDQDALWARIIQDFAVIEQKFFFSGDAKIDDKVYEKGTVVDEKVASSFADIGTPHCTVLLKLMKYPLTRIADPLVKSHLNSLPGGAYLGRPNYYQRVDLYPKNK